MTKYKKSKEIIKKNLWLVTKKLLQSKFENKYRLTIINYQASI